MSKKITTIEDLAVMIQGEFSHVREEFNGGFTALNKRLDSIVEEVLAIKMDLEQVKSTLANVAYRFEIQDLEKRIKIVENKLGIEYE